MVFGPFPFVTSIDIFAVSCRIIDFTSVTNKQMHVQVPGLFCPSKYDSILAC